MSRNRRRTILAIVAGGYLAVAPVANAGPGHDAIYVRAGALSEGPQHTIKGGLDLGAGFDWSVHDRYVLGLGLALARQSESPRTGEEVSIVSFEGHSRWFVTAARVRPVLEFGLGYYWFHIPSTGLIGERPDGSAPGAWLGLGAETGITRRLSARLGIAYHLIAQSITLEGGNLEDYFATGITLTCDPGR